MQQQDNVLVVGGGDKPKQELMQKAVQEVSAKHKGKQAAVITTCDTSFEQHVKGGTFETFIFSSDIQMSSCLLHLKYPCADKMASGVCCTFSALVLQVVCS